MEAVEAAAEAQGVGVDGGGTGGVAAGVHGDIIALVLQQQKSASLKPLLYCAFVILLTSFSSGFEMAFTIVGQAYYSADEQRRNIDPGGKGGGGAVLGSNKIALDEEEISWFVSMISISTIPGSLLSGALTASIGCKWSLRISCILVLAGHGIILAANQPWHVLIARTIQGLGCGLSLPTCLTLLGDISTVRMRAGLIMSNVTTNNIGCLVGLFIGKLLLGSGDGDAVGAGGGGVGEGSDSGAATEPLASDETRLVRIIGCFAVPPLLFLLLSITMPESPVYSAKKGDKEGVIKAIRFLRGSDCAIDAEVDEMLICTDKDGGAGGAGEAGGGGVRKQRFGRQDSWRDTNPYASPRFLKPLGLMVTTMVFVAYSGIDPVFYYCLQLFRGRDMVVDTFTISICCQVGVSAGYIGMACGVNHLPRRVMGAIGSFVMAVSIIALGAVWSYVDSVEDDHESGVMKTLAYYLPPVVAFVFTAAYGGGFGGMAWTLSSELFPPRVKSLGCSISVLVRFVNVFGLLKVYPYLLHLVGSAHISLIHGFVCLLASAFVAFCMPETKGLTTYQITHLFANKEFVQPRLGDCEKDVPGGNSKQDEEVSSSADALISEETLSSTEGETDTLTQESA